MGGLPVYLSRTGTSPCHGVPRSPDRGWLAAGPVRWSRRAPLGAPRGSWSRAWSSNGSRVLRSEWASSWRRGSPPSGWSSPYPPAAGYGLDRWLRTMPVATVIGVVLGFVVGMLHAVRIVAASSQASSVRGRRSRDEPARLTGPIEREASTQPPTHSRRRTRCPPVASPDRGQPHRGKPWLDTPTTPWTTSSITTRSRSRGGRRPTFRLEDPPAVDRAASRSRGSW